MGRGNLKNFKENYQLCLKFGNDENSRRQRRYSRSWKLSSRGSFCFRVFTNQLIALSKYASVCSEAEQIDILKLYPWQMRLVNKRIFDIADIIEGSWLEWERSLLLFFQKLQKIVLILGMIVVNDCGHLWVKRLI